MNERGSRFGRMLLLPAIVAIASACDQFPAAQPFDADGELTEAELNYFLADLQEATNISDTVDECIKGQAERRAGIAGDPETLDPATLSLPEGDWVALEKSDKRLILAQFVVTDASVFCTTGREMGATGS